MQLFIQGSEIDIENLIRKSFGNIDPMPATMLYSASKGDLANLEKVIDNLGIITQKSIILEFLLFLLNKSWYMKEIGIKIGVYDEDIETFEALTTFVMTITKLKSQIIPKILSEKEENKTKIKRELGPQRI